LGLKDRKNNRKTNRRKKHIKSTHKTIESYIQVEGGVSRLTNNRIKSIKNIELIDLYLIITEYLSPKNIDL
jgi:tartrate dehydratase beta subunit/fumarate hydratase class I family protein